MVTFGHFFDAIMKSQELMKDILCPNDPTCDETIARIRKYLVDLTEADIRQLNEIVVDGVDSNETKDGVDPEVIRSYRLFLKAVMQIENNIDQGSVSDDEIVYYLTQWTCSISEFFLIGSRIKRWDSENEYLLDVLIRDTRMMDACRNHLRSRQRQFDTLEDAVQAAIREGWPKSTALAEKVKRSRHN